MEGGAEERGEGEGLRLSRSTLDMGEEGAAPAA